ncbi:hypothetical protein, partial [Cylindrospermopsis raciborskii]|uniref:hypothetical protein n=1 Tax=Cylindrospermopsis raciborskii TaxID=77022 RepID=UPI0026F1ADC6
NLLKGYLLNTSRTKVSFLFVVLEHGLGCDRMAVNPVHLRSTRTCEIALYPLYNFPSIYPIYYNISSPNFL